MPKFNVFIYPPVIIGYSGIEAPSREEAKKKVEKIFHDHQDELNRLNLSESSSSQYEDHPFEVMVDELENNGVDIKGTTRWKEDGSIEVED